MLEELENNEITEDLEDPLNTGWENPPQLKDLKADFDKSKSFHDENIAKIQTWRDNLNVEGEAAIKTPPNKSGVQPKLIRKQAEWRYTALSEPFLSSDHIWRVLPRTWEDRPGSQKNELIINYQFNNHIKRVNFIDNYVRNAVDEGTVVLKTGWEFKEGTRIVPVYSYTPMSLTAEQTEQFMQTLAGAIQLKMASPSEYELKVNKALKKSVETYLESDVVIQFRATVTGYKSENYTITNHPTVVLCNIDNIWFDPTCGGDLDKASFIIEGYESSKALLKEEGDKYQNIDSIKSSGNRDTDPNLSIPGDTNFTFADKARQKINVYTYWGYWDIHNTGQLVSIVVSWVDDVVIQMQENPFPDKKLPFVVVPYLPRKDSLYGDSDGSLLEDNQKIIGAVTRGMIDLMAKNASGQTGFQKHMLDVTNKRKYERGEDYEFNPNFDPRAGIFTHSFPEIPRSAFEMIQHQNLEAESLTGVKAFSQGLTGSSLGNVATAVKGVLDAASKREAGILRRLAAGLEEVGRRFIAMNAEFLDEQTVIRITNENFEQVERDAIKGNFDLKLVIDTAEENAARAQELAFILQTMGNTLDPSSLKILLSTYAKLSKLPDVAHAIENYQPEPDPFQQQIQQLQLLKLQAEIETEKARAMHWYSQTDVNMSKAPVEQAKARNLETQTNQNTLDFVEQETGTTQARHLQQIAEQARSNSDYAKVKHELELQKIAFEKQLNDSSINENSENVF